MAPLAAAGQVEMGPGHNIQCTPLVQCCHKLWLCKSHVVLPRSGLYLDIMGIFVFLKNQPKCVTTKTTMDNYPFVLLHVACSLGTIITCAITVDSMSGSPRSEHYDITGFVFLGLGASNYMPGLMELYLKTFNKIAITRPCGTLSGFMREFRFCWWSHR